MSLSITIHNTHPKWNEVVTLLHDSSEFSKPTKYSPPEKEESESDDDDGEEAEAYDWNDLEVGMQVLVDFGDDGHIQSEITSMPKKNKDQIQVTPGDTQEAEMVPIEDILEVLESEEEEEEEEGGLEFNPGDDVIFKEGRKKVQGTIKSVDEKKETAKVKVPGTRKLSIVDFDKLAFLD